MFMHIIILGLHVLDIIFIFNFCFSLILFPDVFPWLHPMDRFNDNDTGHGYTQWLKVFIYKGLFGAETIRTTTQFMKIAYTNHHTPHIVIL